MLSVISMGRSPRRTRPLTNRDSSRLRLNGARVDIAQGRLRRLRQLGSAAQPLSEALQMPIALS